MKELTIPPKFERILGSVLTLFPLVLAALVVEPYGIALRSIRGFGYRIEQRTA